MRNILAGIFHTLSYQEKAEESYIQKLLRLEIVQWACIFDVDECKEKTTSRLEKHLEDPTNNKYFL